MRTVIVDDDLVMQLLLSRVLTVHGFEPVVISKADEVFDYDWTEADAVIVDQYLDTDLRGTDILEFLAESHPHLRTVMLTGDSSVRTCKADVLLYKPAPPDVVIAALRG